MNELLNQGNDRPLDAPEAFLAIQAPVGSIGPLLEDILGGSGNQ